jgi:hypothetical protein
MRARLLRCAAHALFATLLTGTVAVGLAAPTVASCAVIPEPAQAVREAELAFVGRVVGLANQDRWATVAVEEVWVGPDLSTTVEVRGGSEGNTASSVDRSFAAGTRYLFTVTQSEGRLHDSSCSGTTVWAPDLARLRPADARPPIGASLDPPPAEDVDPLTVLVPLLAAAGVGGIVFGLVGAIRRLQR